MKFDSGRFGTQGLSNEDRQYAGSRFSEVREALFRNAYYLDWGEPGEPPLPSFEVTLWRVLAGLFNKWRRWHFLDAAARALDAQSDMRWGDDNLGWRRLLHPNGVCLFGKWIIDQPTEYSGYFQDGSRGLIVGRYSTCCTECRRGQYRSLSLVGKIYPTEDPDHTQALRTANFITQEDLGGALTEFINDAVLRNAPDTTPWRRGWGTLILLLTGLAFKLVDREPTIRQLYPIAELGKPESTPTCSPRFMQLTVRDGQTRVRDGRTSASTEQLDFRDEILSQFHRPREQSTDQARVLVFDIEVTDVCVTSGLLKQRRSFPSGWKKIGRIEFTEAVASYNGDFVVHFHHPPWRKNPDDASTTVRKRSTI